MINDEQRKALMRMAFPLSFTHRTNGTDVVEIAAGLTKRELFAALAMQGYCSNYKDSQLYTIEATAQAAVRMADALIAALEAATNSQPIAAPLKSDERNGGAE